MLKILIAISLLQHPLVHAGCLRNLLNAIRSSQATLAEKSYQDYQRYLTDWRTLIREVAIDPARLKKIKESALANPRKHRLYVGIIGEEPQQKFIVLKNYGETNHLDIRHELAMLKVCEDLGIKTTPLVGSATVEGVSPTLATEFVNGSVLAIRYGPRLMKYPTSLKEGKITAETLPKIEAICDKLKAAGIEAHDLQFIITPLGEPYLMDVGNFFFSEAVTDPLVRKTIPDEGWTEHNLRIYRPYLRVEN